jgi:hypothetical protein
MNRQEAERAQTVLIEADHTGRLADLEIVDPYNPETAHVESPVYTIVVRTKDGYMRHISDYHEALAFAAKLRLRRHPKRGRSGGPGE